MMFASGRMCLTYPIFSTAMSHNMLTSIHVVTNQMVDVPVYGEVSELHFNLLYCVYLLVNF